MRLSQEQRKLQNVFRIPKPSDPTGPAPDTEHHTSQGKKQCFRQRKTHRKSRKGCRNCKTRHVRCDETVGGCLRCKTHGIECDYVLFVSEGMCQETVAPATTSANETDRAHSSASHSRGSMPLVSLFNTSRHPRFVASPPHNMPSSPVLPAPSSTINDTLDSRAILHHFYTMTALTCGSPASQAVNRSAVVAAAVQTPYLMHALLGLATAHLRHLTGRDMTVTRTKLKVAECFYWAKAFDGFRRELAGADESCGIIITKRSNVTRANMDQLLSTLMLVSMHQFSYRDYHHNESEPADKSFVWIEDRPQRDAALKWLGIEAGFKGLIQAMAPWLSQSFWLPIMRTVDVDDEADLKSWISAQTLDETEGRLAAICGIMLTSACPNAYYANLETLIWCRKFRPIGPEHFNQMIAFVGRTTPEFRELVLERDTAALIVLLHWLHLMTDIGQWWIVERCRAEIRAITTFLYYRNVLGCGDQDVLMLLEQPAAAVDLDLLPLVK